MRCVDCGGESSVVDSRPRDNTVCRRRVCWNPKCGRRWATYEIDAEVNEVVLMMFKAVDKVDEALSALYKLKADLPQPIRKPVVTKRKKREMIKNRGVAPPLKKEAIDG